MKARGRAIESSAQRLRRDHRLLRRLTLTHDGEPFLDRWGLVHERLGGFYVHRIAGPDPGLDLHDHPWGFVSIILRGGYEEEVAPCAVLDYFGGQTYRALTCWSTRRTWRRWTAHRMPLTIAHRITATKPNTWTLVLRGPTRRPWGFYVDGGWVVWDEYDYATRRPSTIKERT